MIEFTTALSVKLVGYILISILGVIIFALAIRPLWRHRMDFAVPATWIVGAFAVEGLSNSLYFGYWVLENLTGHPRWMLDHWGLVAVTWAKVLVSLIILAAMTRSKVHR